VRYALAAALSVCALARADGGAVERYEFSEPAMGTMVHIVLYAPNAEVANGAAEAAFARIAELNGILSDYDPESELKRLCAVATAENAVEVSDELWAVLARSAEISDASGGAFDITVAPVVGLWRQARALMRAPKPERIAEALTHVGWRHVLLDSSSRSVRLELPGMGLDLGGIAKGFAIDEALRTLREHGVRSALVDAGGDIGTAAAPPGRKGWRVAIAALDAEAPERYLEVANRAVATSGDKWQYVVLDGVRYSHIVDPRTGTAITGRRSVTVVASDAMTADAWATALSVLDAREGWAMVEAGVAAYCVHETENGRETLLSDGWLALERGGMVKRADRE